MATRMYGAAMVTAVLLLFAIAGGCVTGVESGTEIRTSKDLLPFSGMTYTPNELIEIDAFNKSSQKWEVIGTTRSSTTGTVLGYTPKETLYGWSKHIRFVDPQTDADNFPAWRCYFGGPLCNVPWQQTTVRFRVRSDGPIQTLFTFGPGGVKCMADRVGKGKALVTSYDECKPTSPYTSDEITVIKPADVGGWDF